MRHWMSAALTVTCGACGARVLEGQPVQVIRLNGVRTERYRCQHCADGPVDYSETGPAYEPSTPPTFARLKQFARLPIDSKTRASGERE